MKKILQGILSVVLSILMFSAQAIAYTNSAAINSEVEISAVVDFDEAMIYDAFTEVDALIATIENNENITYNDLASANSEMVANVNNIASVAYFSYNDPPLIGAFWWGCLTGLIPPLGVVGVAIVYFTTKDNKQTWKAIGGCLISGLLVGGGYLSVQ